MHVVQVLAPLAVEDVVVDDLEASEGYDTSLLKTRVFRAVLETRHPGDSAAFVPGGSIGLLMYLAASHVVLR